MRFLMHVSCPTEPWNQYFRDGTAGEKISRIVEDLKPEAAYFTAQDGKRGGIFVVNLEKASDMPRYAEPFFMTFNASVEFLLAMTPKDLQDAGLDQIGKKWK